MPGTDLSTFIWLTISNSFALSLSFFSRIIYDSLIKFIITYRQYQTHNSTKLTETVLEKIESHHWLSDGKIILRGKMIPHGLVIGKNFRFLASVEALVSSDTNKCDALDITVWTWRWDRPIVSDISNLVCNEEFDEDNNHGNEGYVKVMRMGLYNTYACRKESARPINCPTLKQSEFLAQDMYKSWLENERNGRFIISGPPGCGKSISVRILASKMNGTLCPYYNPTKPRVSIEDIIDTTFFTRENPLVIAMDEFDKCLDKLIDSNPSMDRNIVEVGTKSDWTNLMDYMQFRPDIIMVMVTNKTFAEIDEIDKKYFDGALLRTGRVTDRFLMT